MESPLKYRLFSTGKREEWRLWVKEQKGKRKQNLELNLRLFSAIVGARLRFAVLEAKYCHGAFRWHFVCWIQREPHVPERLCMAPVLLNQRWGKMDVRSTAADGTKSNWKALRGLIASKKKKENSAHGQTFCPLCTKENIHGVALGPPLPRPKDEWSIGPGSPCLATSSNYRGLVYTLCWCACYER